TPALDELRAWAERSATGDRAELAELPDDSPLWREVSSTTETRLGGRCPHFEDCFVTRARRQAQAADLLVVNHHLFFADLALQEVEGLLGRSNGETREAEESRAALSRRARSVRDDLAAVSDRSDRSRVYWIETRGRTVFLHGSPIDVAAELRERLFSQVETAV